LGLAIDVQARSVTTFYQMMIDLYQTWIFGGEVPLFKPLTPSPLLVQLIILIDMRIGSLGGRLRLPGQMLMPFPWFSRVVTLTKLMFARTSPLKSGLLQTSAQCERAEWGVER
jgi:hypothetical protein